MSADMFGDLERVAGRQFKISELERLPVSRFDCGDRGENLVEVDVSAREDVVPALIRDRRDERLAEDPLLGVCEISGVILLEEEGLASGDREAEDVPVCGLREGEKGVVDSLLTLRLTGAIFVFFLFGATVSGTFPPSSSCIRLSRDLFLFIPILSSSDGPVSVSRRLSVASSPSRFRPRTVSLNFVEFCEVGVECGLLSLCAIDVGSILVKTERLCEFSADGALGGALGAESLDKSFAGLNDLSFKGLVGSCLGARGCCSSGRLLILVNHVLAVDRQMGV